MSQSYSAYFSPQFSTGLGYLSWSLSYKSCRLVFWSKGYLWTPMPASDGASSFNLILQNKLKKHKKFLLSGIRFSRAIFLSLLWDGLLLAIAVPFIVVLVLEGSMRSPETLKIFSEITVLCRWRRVEFFMQILLEVKLIYLIWLILVMVNIADSWDFPSGVWFIICCSVWEMFWVFT